MKATAVGTGLLAVPAGFVAMSRFRDAARGLLIRELGFLQHNPDGMDRFIDQYFAGSSDTDRLRILVLNAMKRGAEESWTVGDMVDQYLMGSDFFRAGMNEQRVVTFGRLHSPYQGGCSNPFSAPYFPRQIAAGL